MTDADLLAPFSHPQGWAPLPWSDPPVPPPPRWVYDGADPALGLFTAAVARFGMRFPAHSRVVELGCSESDWLERMARMDPTLDLVGVDARAQTGRDGLALRQASALDGDLFDEASCDWVVMLGALEHFGLGFYGDPVDPDGDRICLQHVARWLRPGGFLYFDVPCQPTYRIAENRHFRSYAPDDIQGRLLPPGLMEINRGYSLPEPDAGTWCHEPTFDRVPYWFVAVLAQRRPDAD
jgi:SAM-dependent methyltransferase